MIRWLVYWWKARHVCDDEILESDNAGYISQCRVCKRLMMYPGGEIRRPACSVTRPTLGRDGGAQ